MFHIENLYLFFTVSILINLSPGPDMIYTAARSLSQGTRAGIYSALGIFAGCLIHTSAAVFGLSAIIAESVLVFSIIKYAGAFYLMYLGIRTFLKREGTKQEIKVIDPLPAGKLFFQGMLTNVLNPKVAIFFLSFLPQFIDPHSAHLKEKIAFLGLWFDVQGTLILIIVAGLTGAFKNTLQKNSGFWNWQEKITGLVLFGVGLRMLFSKK